MVTLLTEKKLECWKNGILEYLRKITIFVKNNYLPETDFGFF